MVDSRVARRWGRCVAGLGLVLAAGLAGCASKSQDVTGSYVSPLMYEPLQCHQLAAEAQRISLRVTELSGEQDRRATNDAIATGAAIVIFWPAAFFVGGDDHKTAELARLKGEFEAVERTATAKSCGLELRQQSASAAAAGAGAPIDLKPKATPP